MHLEGGVFLKCYELQPLDTQWGARGATNCTESERFDLSSEWALGNLSRKLATVNLLTFTLQGSICYECCNALGTDPAKLAARLRVGIALCTLTPSYPAGGRGREPLSRLGAG